VVDYVPGPKGTLTVQRFDCAEGAEGTTIEIGGGPANDSCLPSNERVSVSGGDAAPILIDLGEDGATSVDVAAGDYVVSDGSTPASIDVPVTEGSSVTVTINSTILTGSVSASMFWCDSSVSSSVNPGNLGNWSNGCGRVGSGMVISLLDANGDLVSTATTGSNGSLSFSSLTPGQYSLSTSSGCALFANGADVDTTIVGGHVLMRNRKLIHQDENAILARAEALNADLVILNTEVGGQKAKAKLAEKIAAKHDKIAVLIARSTA